MSQTNCMTQPYEPPNQPPIHPTEYPIPPAPYPQSSSAPYSLPILSQPAELALAVKLMFVGAGLSVLGMLIGFTELDSVREATEKAVPAGTSQTIIDASVAAGIGVLVVGGVLGTGLWILNAVYCGKGKNWSRILAAVAFGFAVLSPLAAFTQPIQPLSFGLNLISLGLGAYITYLLWRPSSSQYFAQNSNL